MKKYLALLAKMPLFEEIAPADIPATLNCLQAQKRAFGKDSFLRNEGDPADFIGIVLEGAIRILQYDFHGNRSITATLSAGEMFAEAISCAGIPALPFSIQAVTDCVVLFVDQKKILSGCDGGCVFHSRLVQNLLTIVSQKNLLLNQKLRCLSRKTTAEKLLSYLDDQAKLHRSNEFTIPYDRQGLADYLGVERSAMAAEIGKLKKQGILETTKSHFKLLQPDVRKDEGKGRNLS